MGLDVPVLREIPIGLKAKIGLKSTLAAPLEPVGKRIDLGSNLVAEPIPGFVEQSASANPVKGWVNGRLPRARHAARLTPSFIAVFCQPIMRAICHRRIYGRKLHNCN